MVSNKKRFEDMETSINRLSNIVQSLQMGNRSDGEGGERRDRRSERDGRTASIIDQGQGLRRFKRRVEGDESFSEAHRRGHQDQDHQFARRQEREYKGMQREGSFFGHNPFATYPNPFRRDGSEHSPDDTDNELSGKSSTESDQSIRIKREQTPKDHRHKAPRVDFPKFGGDDALNWVDKAEQYFEWQEVKVRDCVKIASYYLEGEARQWWRWFEQVYGEGEISWPSFKQGVLTRFGTAQHEDANEIMSKLRQTGNFRDYLREFEKAMSRVPHWPPSALLGTFMAGLKPEIAIELKMWRPHNLREAIELATRKEEQLRMARAPVIPNRIFSTNNKGYQPQNTGPSQATTRSSSATEGISSSKPRSSTPMIGRGRIQLSNEEIHRRRQAGLCFTCNEKYTWNHVCSNAKIMSLIVDDVIVSNDYDQPPRYDEEKIDEATDKGIERQEMGISFNHYGGNKKQALRLNGTIYHHSVTILVDSGASLNFISTDLAHNLNLQATQCSKSLLIVAGNGQKMACDAWYERVSVVVQGVCFQMTFYALPMPHLDIIFGWPWFEGVSPLIFDAKECSCNFWMGDQLVLLKGIGYTPPDVRELNAIEKEIAQGSEFFLLTSLGTVNETVQGMDILSDEIARLLSEFKEISEPTKKLPPHESLTIESD